MDTAARTADIIRATGVITGDIPAMAMAMAGAIGVTADSWVSVFRSSEGAMAAEDAPGAIVINPRFS